MITSQDSNMTRCNSDRSGVLNGFLIQSVFQYILWLQLFILKFDFKFCVQICLCIIHSHWVIQSLRSVSSYSPKIERKFHSARWPGDIPKSGNQVFIFRLYYYTTSLETHHIYDTWFCIVNGDTHLLS